MHPDEGKMLFLTYSNCVKNVQLSDLPAVDTVTLAITTQ